MRRRTVLATAGTVSLLSGCVGNTDDREGENTETDADDGSEKTENFNGEDTPSVRDWLDGDPVRPECTVESETITVGTAADRTERETAATVPYPVPPEMDDRDAVIEYVEAFDHALVTQEALCDRADEDHILEITHRVFDRETVDRDDHIRVVVLFRAAGAREGADEDGTIWLADIGPTGVVYAVDGTGLARVDFPEAGATEPDEFESEAPDPLVDGTLVASFE